MYWQEQLRRTRHPVHKAQMALVLQAVEAVFERHPRTPTASTWGAGGLASVGGGYAAAFQRASSAVEGRNGYLSQMQHNHRQLLHAALSGVDGAA